MSDRVITANRLRDGAAVWRDADGNWAEHFDAAAVRDAASADAEQEAAKADIARRLVVGVYVVSVTRHDGQARPDNERERIRARGPSVRLDLGMQAQT